MYDDDDDDDEEEEKDEDDGYSNTFECIQLWSSVVPWWVRREKLFIQVTSPDERLQQADEKTTNNSG